MEFNKKNIKYLVLIIFGCILFYLGLKNITSVIGGMGYIISILMPFIVGVCIAFIINVPMSKIEYYIFGRTEKFKKSRRAISFLIILAILVGVITIALYTIIPQIAIALQSVAAKMPEAINVFQDFLNRTIIKYKALDSLFNGKTFDWSSISDKASDYIRNYAKVLLNSGIGAVSNIISLIINFFIGFIFAIYILMKKETLARQGKQVIWAIFREDIAEKILYICALTSRTFSKFISGECLEICILGSLVFVTMTIIKLPYAMLIAVIVALTALVPMIGTSIGCILGTLLIMIDSPSQAVIFVIMFVIIQQIDGNFIYPHVVGGTIGLPSIWVIVAITVGGNLMGVIGMILSIPTCSVLYALFRIFVKDRLQKKNIPSEKWEKSLEIDENVMTRRK